MERLYYGYADFLQDLKTLVQKIEGPFDAIVPVARGGLCMAHLMGEYWNIRKVCALNAVGYDDTKRLDGIEIFNLPQLKGVNRALIVDDIADSGRTLAEVKSRLQSRHPTIDFYTATLFYKPTKSCIEPDWWVKEADAWIDFFWSEDLKRAF